MSNETKYKLSISPKGIAVYPKIQEADKKYKKEYGEYSTKLRVTVEEATAMKAEWKTAFDAAYAIECAKQGKKSLKLSPATPFAKEIVKEEAADGTEVERETGMILVKFSQIGGYKEKKSGKEVLKRVSVVDANKAPVKSEVWGGSEIKVAYTYKPFFSDALGFGVTLRLNAVQVLKLVTKGDGGAASAFDKEDGYTETEDTAPEFEAPAVVEGATHVATTGKADF